MLLGFLVATSLGNGFDSSKIAIFVNGQLIFSESFNNLASAQAFFTQDSFNLGQPSNGLTNVSLIFDETMSSNQGFGFTYAVATTSIAGGVPEPSIWALMLIGFAGLGFISYRRTRRAPKALVAASSEYR
jgi:hypothetical protein